GAPAQAPQAPAAEGRSGRSGTALKPARLAVRTIDEQDAFRDPARVGDAGNRTPQHKRLVAVAQVAGVVVLVRVAHRVRPAEAELAPQLLDVVRLPGQELPALAYAMRARKALQHPRRIALRVDRDRVHEQVTADALFEQVLH